MALINIILKWFRDIGGMILTVMAFWSSLVMHHDRDRTVLVCYTIAIPITLYVRHSVSDSLVQGQGLPVLEQALSWILLCNTLVLIRFDHFLI
jgi:hypothetical protein